MENIKDEFEGEHYINIEEYGRMNKVIIKHIGDNMFRLTSPNVWDGVGIFDGKMYIGVFEYKHSFGNAHLSGIYGNHYAIRQDDGSFVFVGANKIGLTGEFTFTLSKIEDLSVECEGL